MLKFYFLILLTLTGALSQDNQLEVVRFNAEQEAWLNKDIDKAIELLLPQAESNKADAVTLYNVGYMYYLRGNNSKALNFLQKAITKDVKYPYAYLITAQIYKKTGNLLGALTQLRRGLTANSENYELLLESGGIYHALGETDQAEKIFLQLIDSSEEKAAPRIALAKIYRGRQEYDKALQILDRKRFIELPPAAFGLA